MKVVAQFKQYDDGEHDMLRDFHEDNFSLSVVVNKNEICYYYSH